jgi:hypothetical protein
MENREIHAGIRLTATENQQLENYLLDTDHKTKSAVIRKGLLLLLNDYWKQQNNTSCLAI